VDRALIIGAVAGLALLAGAWVLSSSDAPPSSPSPTPPPAQPEAGQSGSAPGANLGALAKTGSSAAGTIAAGIVFADTVGNAVEAAGAGKAAGDVSRVFGTGGLSTPLAVVGAHYTAAAVEKITGSHEVGREAGVVAGVGIVAGGYVAAAAAVVQVVGKGLLEGFGLIAGDSAKRAVSNAFSQFDPFKHGSAANTVVGAVGSGVSAAAHWIGGLF
jgi:hypothetical protein